MLRGLVVISFCATLVSTFKYEGKNILAIGMSKEKLHLVTKSLAVYQLDPSSLPKEVDVNVSSRDMSSVWPGLTNEKRLHDCLTKDCRLWLQSGQIDSVFFATPEVNYSIQYDAKSGRQLESEALPYNPYAIMLSSDQPDAMYIVERQLGGILFTVVQYSAENNTMEVNDTRLLCFYSEDNRVQFSQDLFHTPCKMAIDWGPIVGFVADDTFYLFGNTSKVYIFEAKVYQYPAVRVRTVPYFDFVIQPSGLSTVAIVLIVLVTGTLALVVLIAVCCFLRKKKIIGNKGKGSTGKEAGAKRSRSRGSHRKTKGSKSRKRSSLKSKRRSSLKSKKRRSSLKSRKASSAKKSSRISAAKSRKLSAAKSAKLGKRSSVMSKKRSSALKTRSLIKSRRVSSGRNVQSRRSLKRNTMLSLKASNGHTRRSSRSHKKSSRLTSVQSKRASASKLKTSKRSSRASSRKSSRASSRKSSRASSKRR